MRRARAQTKSRTATRDGGARDARLTSHDSEWEGVTPRYSTTPRCAAMRCGCVLSDVCCDVRMCASSECAERRCARLGRCEPCVRKGRVVWFAHARRGVDRTRAAGVDTRASWDAQARGCACRGNLASTSTSGRRRVPPVRGRAWGWCAGACVRVNIVCVCASVSCGAARDGRACVRAMMRARRARGGIRPRRVGR